MTGGYEGNLTTSSLVNASLKATVTLGSPFNYGGKLGTSGGDTLPTFNWESYIFPTYGGTDSFAYSMVNGAQAWSWTYALPNGNVWVNAGTGSSGDILTTHRLEAA